MRSVWHGRIVAPITKKEKTVMRKVKLEADASPSDVPATPIQKKAGWVLVTLSVVLTLATTFLNLTRSLTEFAGGGLNEIAHHIGAMAGRVYSPIILSLTIMMFFQIGRRFRNNRSQFVVYCWSMAIFLLVTVSSFLQSVVPATHP